MCAFPRFFLHVFFYMLIILWMRINSDKFKQIQDLGEGDRGKLIRPVSADHTMR